MWLGFEWVPEEDDEVDASFGDRGPDLLVAAERPTQEPMYGQIEFIGDERAGCSGRLQLVLGERSAIEACPFDEIGFAVVVGDQRDALAERHRGHPIHTRTVTGALVERRCHGTLKGHKVCQDVSAAKARVRPPKVARRRTVWRRPA